MLIIAVLMIPAYASETDDFDYAGFFSRSTTVDGAAAEVYALEVLELYECNPSEFLEQLSYESEEIIDSVTFFLACEQHYNDFDVFKAYVAAELEAGNHSQQVATVLNSVQFYIDLLEYSNNNPGEAIPPPEPDAFHVATVRGFIYSWLALNMQEGESFYNTIAKAYVADPVLFAAMVSDLSESAIDILAQGLANSLLGMEITEVDESSSVLSAKISESLADIAEDSDIVADIVIPSENEAEPLVTYYSPQPSVTSMEYTSGTFRVGETVTLNVILSETSYISQVRRYGIRVYTIRDGEMVYLTPEQIVYMSPGSSSISVNFTYTLTEAEELQTFVRITNPSTGVAVYSMRKRYTDVVTGQWSITVELTEDRSQLGTITLFNASGTEVSSAICLGKSAKNYPMNQTYGHTPIGIYSGYLEDHWDDDNVYGPCKVIKMTGVSGYVVDSYSHRSGIWIHGGREGYNDDEKDPSYPLYHTYGCVRVTNTYQLQLENEISELMENYHDTIGKITITQDGEITLGED